MPTWSHIIPPTRQRKFFAAPSVLLWKTCGRLMVSEGRPARRRMFPDARAGRARRATRRSSAACRARSRSRAVARQARRCRRRRVGRRLGAARGEDRPRRARATGRQRIEPPRARRARNMPRPAIAFDPERDPCAPTARSRSGGRRRRSRTGGSAVIVASVSSPSATPRSAIVLRLRAAHQLVGGDVDDAAAVGRARIASTRPSSLSAGGSARSPARTRRPPGAGSG